MGDDNLSRQVDEIEALTSIYGDEWCVQDATRRLYCIRICDGSDPPKLNLNLEVTLPPEYPSDAPPVYQLNAPWLRGEDRMILGNALEDLYCENLGESVIYLWVEKIREFLAEKGEQTLTCSSASVSGEDVQHTQQPAVDRLPIENLHITKTEETLECPEIHHGGFISDRKSVFQAHLAAVHHKDQVQLVMDKLCENKKIASATHNIVACRIVVKQEPLVMYQDCVDDGETHAGSRMLHLLQIIDAQDVIVVVTRWYGGIHLGPDRFKHINNCAREILDEHGYIKDKSNKKDDKKSSKSHSKKSK